MSVTVEYYSVDRSQVWDITQVTTNIEVNGAIDRYYRSAAITVAARSNVPFNTGGRVRVYADKKLIFDGKVFSYSNSSAQGVSLVCHDNAYYLERNVVNLIRFEDGDGTTLTDLFKSYCKRAGIKTGFVKNTTHKHKNINYLGETMQTVLQGLIGRERRGSGKKLFVQAEGDKLSLRERGAMQGIVIGTDMASEVTATLDAHNIYTRIKTVGTKEVTSNGSSTGVANITAIHSSNYKGPDATSYQSGFRARLKASDRWDPIILNVANQQKVDPLLLKILVMLESSGNPNAVSSDGVGSRGLTQITPGSYAGKTITGDRLFDPQYSIEMTCYILTKDKLPIAKRLDRTASSVNMAHFWNGWPPSHGESDSDYSATFRTIYKGFGGDPDKLFTDIANTSSNAEENGNSVSSAAKEVFQGFASNASLVNKFGNMENIVRVKANNAREAAQEAQRLANQMREERTVVVRCKGHYAALTGRKVHFRDNDYAKGTWYIKADTHVITSNGHEVTLTLDKYDQTPEPEVPIGPERETEANPTDGANTAPSRDHKFLIQPAMGRISQSYGPATYRNAKYSFHNGIDIANSVGTPIRAAASGRVAQVGYSAGGYGNYIIIWHFPDGLSGQKWVTLYGHLSTVGVKEGQLVNQGDTIGKMGSTGFSTGSHLHFELHKGERIYDAHQARNSANPAIYF